MESVLLLMTLLCLIAGVFRNSLAPGKYYPAVFAVMCALFVFFAGSYAVQINKLSVIRAFADFSVMQNLNVLLTLHMLFSLGFAAAKMQKSFGLQRGIFYRILEYIPALMVFPALFYLYLVLLFSFAGTSFSIVGTVFALSAFLLMGGGSYLLRAAIPETELRTELLLMVELLLFVLMVSSTVFHPSAVLFSVSSAPDWKSLLYTTVTVAALFGMGYVRLLSRLKALSGDKKER